MARIPLQTANRSLDTGSAVQYPSGSPIGAALENAGNTLSAAAQRVKQKDDQRDDFDARIRETEFTAAQAGLEDQAVQTAPEDAAGLHDGVVGQIDPVTNRAIKPGSFDTLFDQYKAKMPASKQADFEAKRDVYRLQSSNRLAGAQYQGEQAYYKVQIQKTQDGIINSILAGDPNDTATYDQFRQRGLEIIDKSGLPALAKDVAKTNWEANASETLFKLKLEKDPAFAASARGALGLAPVTSGQTSGRISGANLVAAVRQVESGGNPNAESGKGASGSMQVTPATGREIARELGDTSFPMNGSDAQVKAYLKSPGVSERYGEHYLDKMLRRYDGDTAAALVAYNGGPARADEWLKSGRNDNVIPAETRDYYKKVMRAAGGGERQSVAANVPNLPEANSFLKTRLVGHTGDHIDNLKPEMQQRLAALIQSAPPEIAGKLGVYSGARSVARQKELWDAAVIKYGSPEAARKWVAPPGKSNHNAGAAADMSYEGKSLKNAPPEVVAWVHKNAAQFGLKFPLANENWHVELDSTRGGVSGGDPAFSAIPPDRRLVLANQADGKVAENQALLRGGIETTVQNAPIAIQNTGTYSGPLPGPEDFNAAYGPQNGAERYAAFQALIETSQQSNAMRTMPVSDINAMVDAAKPLSTGDTAALDQKRYDTLAAARDNVMKAREADPAGYTQQVFPSIAQAWQNPPAGEGGRPDYQGAMALTAAAQQQLGIKNMQLLPTNLAASTVETFKDENRSSADRVGAIAGMVFSTSDPAQRQAVFDQLVKAGLPDITAGALRATARGDAGAARRLFEAAMTDVSKLPGQSPEKPAAIDEAIQTQLMDSGQLGDVYYGLSNGSADNLLTAQRDAKLMTNAVTLRVRNGESLSSAVDAVAKDLFGDVKTITGDNYQIIVPTDADEGAVVNGLQRQLPTVQSALEAAYLTSYAAVPKAAPKGLTEQGNIDLAKRPVVNNPDGTISTVRSMSFGEDGVEVLIPTVSPDGKILSDQEAIDLYRQTGQHLGKFATPEDATAYAENLHNAQADFYGKRDASAVMRAAQANDVARIMTNGYFRNSGDGYAFIDPYTGLAVPGEDGKPLIVMPQDIEQAVPGAAFEMRTPNTTGAGPSLDASDNPVPLATQPKPATMQPPPDPNSPSAKRQQLKDDVQGMGFLPQGAP